MVALKTLMFTIVAPGTVVGLVPWLLLQWSGEAVMPFPSLWLIGLLPLLVGVVLYFWPIWPADDFYNVSDDESRFGQRLSEASMHLFPSSPRLSQAS